MSALTIGGICGARAFPDVRPGALVELAPMLRRAAALDEVSLARIVTGKATVTGLVRLPFDVLVGRTLPLPADTDRHAGDYSVLASELLAWIDGDDASPSRGTPTGAAVYRRPPVGSGSIRCRTT